MKCRQCGHENRDGARFCDQCGSLLPAADEAKAKEYREQCIWYYEKHGIRKGPFTLGELSRMKRSGLVQEQTWVEDASSSRKERLKNLLKKDRAGSWQKPAPGWYVSRDQKTIGPYEQKQLEEKIAKGIFTKDDLYMAPDAGEFVPGLKSSLASLFQPEKKPEKKKTKQPEPEEVLWYVSVNGETLSLEKEELIDRIENGTYDAATPVWNSTVRKWLRVDESELKNHLPLQVLQPALSGWMVRDADGKTASMQTGQLKQLARTSSYEDAFSIRKNGWKTWIPLSQSRLLPLLQDVPSGWYALEGQQAQGPMSAAQVLSLESRETLRYWKPGLKEWTDWDSVADMLKKKTAAKKPAVQKENWYLGIDGASQGPYSARRIQQFLEQGIIDENVYVWKKDMKEWVHYKDSPLAYSAPGKESWYYVDNGRSYGPYSYQEMQELFYKGTIDRYTWVWKEGTEGWQAYQDSQLAY